MAPSHAELARTLARGRLPATLRAGDLRGRMHHATDRTGRPLVLLRDGDALRRALPGTIAVPAELSVTDVPPLPGAPSLGQVRISGPLRRLEPAGARAAADEFAQANPVPDLLDLGQGAGMYAMDVAAVVLEHRGTAHTIDLASYAEAEPDPLHELERDLLADLADHHGPRVESYFRFLLAVAGVPCCEQPPRPVRLDRYGFVVDLGSRGWARLNFDRPVYCRHELAQLLHPVLFHRRADQHRH